MRWRRRRMPGAESWGSPSTAASPRRPSAHRSPTTTPIVANACRRTWCRGYATISGRTPISGSTAPAHSTRAGRRMGRKCRSGSLPTPWLTSRGGFDPEQGALLIGATLQHRFQVVEEQLPAAGEALIWTVPLRPGAEPRVSKLQFGFVAARGEHILDRGGLGQAGESPGVNHLPTRYDLDVLAFLHRAELWLFVVEHIPKASAGMRLGDCRRGEPAADALGRAECTKHRVGGCLDRDGMSDCSILDHRPTSSKISPARAGRSSR